MGVRTPIAGSFIMEHTIKVDDLGVRQFIPILGPPPIPFSTRPQQRVYASSSLACRIAHTPHGFKSYLMISHDIACTYSYEYINISS